ncbi:MAG TPA: hypothetical protein VGM92_07305 [Candidatus Kapabacteria bacterium]|jgi:hypothetical protein
MRKIGIECDANKKSQWKLAISRYSFASFAAFLLAMIFVSPAIAQEHIGAGAAADSLHVTTQFLDSLLKADSIDKAARLAEEERFQRTRQLATQREIDLTDDGVPEVLRLECHVPKKIDETKLLFTIKNGKKTLFKDSWYARGYFDTIDHLNDSVKLHRLKILITVFFANENFEVVDSNDFDDMLKNVMPADLKPHSAQAKELFSEPRVMYSVYHSRDYWYGLIWDPKKKKFVKAWRN